MEDTELVELLWQKNSEALSWVEHTYGRLCRHIARTILHNPCDEEECINDAYLALWNSIPPNRPQHLGGYLGTLVRNACLDRYRRDHCQKRGNGQVEMAIEELSQCLPDKTKVEENLEVQALTHEINQFLSTLSQDDRIIFLSRYWLMFSVREMIKDLGFSQAKIRSSLYRTRKKLKAHLSKEEWI